MRLKKKMVHALNPLDDDYWNDRIIKFENSTIFHTSNWAEILQEAYDYKPLYFGITSASKVEGFIPVMEVQSFLTGKRGVSLPFTDLCHPLTLTKIHQDLIIEKILAYGKKAEWRYLELRGGKAHLKDIQPFARFYHHTLTLDQKNNRTLLSGFKGNVRRNIKKATKSNIQISFENSKNGMTKFYDLNCLTRKHHGLPPQPIKFFRSFFHHFIEKKKGLLILALFKNKPIAAGIFLHFNQKAMYKFGASDRRFLNFRANNLILWSAIQWYAENGFISLDLGRTELEHTGLLQFKRGWGVDEEIEHYYKYDFDQKQFVHQAPIVKSSYEIFKRLPIFFLKQIGNYLYRHIG